MKMTRAKQTNNQIEQKHNIYIYIDITTTNNKTQKHKQQQTTNTHKNTQHI